MAGLSSSMIVSESCAQWPDHSKQRGCLVNILSYEPTHLALVSRLSAIGISY